MSNKSIIKTIFTVRWEPTRDIAVVLISYVLVVGALYTATVVVGPQVWNGMAYFFLYAVVTAGILGVGIPLFWMVVVRKQPLSALGITTRRLWLSLGLQVIFAGLQFSGTLAKGAAIDIEKLVPLLALSLTIGFFEALFWRGWMLLRFEESFGLIPAILLGSLLYAVYHVGYVMPLEEMMFLFWIGVMYALAFRLTKNIFILWPVFQPMGQLVTLVKDGLELPPLASLGFIEVLIGMLVMAYFAGRYAMKHRKERVPEPGFSKADCPSF